MQITLNIDNNKIQRIADAFGITTAPEFKQELKKMIKERVESTEINSRVREAHANNINFDVDDSIT